jgi:transposase-like protein
MKRTRHSQEQIIAILKEHEAGVTTADLCRTHGISEQTFYNWKAKYGGLDALLQPSSQTCSGRWRHDRRRCVDAQRPPASAAHDPVM